jgi:hypothetical protein
MTRGNLILREVAGREFAVRGAGKTHLKAIAIPVVVGGKKTNAEMNLLVHSHGLTR